MGLVSTDTFCIGFAERSHPAAQCYLHFPDRGLFMAISRRIAALISTAALTTGLAFVPAVAASADISDCSVSASLPSKLRITSDSMSVATEVEDPDWCMDWASWNIERADFARTSSIIADSAGTEHWTLYTNLYGSDGGPGRYTAVFDTGYDTSSDDLLGDDSNTMTAKFASKIGKWSAHRTGARVSLSVRLTRYTYTNGAYGTPGWGAWKAAAVKFQYRSHGKWHTARTVKAARTGVATATIKHGRTQWRALVANTGTTWGVTGGSHTR